MFCFNVDENIYILMKHIYWYQKEEVKQMSLYVKIQANEDVIRVFCATRKGKAVGMPEGWNYYEVSECPECDNGTGEILGTIQHLHSDGALILAQKIIEFVIETR
jgi:hypothetical protein